MRMRRKDALAKLSGLCFENACALEKAIQYCAGHGIGSFRINSQILPVKTHPRAGYDIKDLPLAEEIVLKFKECGQWAKKNNVRLTFHPDQFIVLSSKNNDVVDRSIVDLEYHALVSEWVGADVINIHGGGAYGDKRSALKRVMKNVKKLSQKVRCRLTFENDEKVYSPVDLIPLCQATGAGFVYDVHHHRCRPDGCSVEEITKKAVKTWNREPLFHISSPIHGWRKKNTAYHHDYINIKDFPKCWLGLDVTVDIEAKAKELAIFRLQKDLKRIEKK